MNEFVLKNGQNPFMKGEPFIKGWLFYGFTNEQGEFFAAYISVTTNDVWFSGEEMDWEWKRFTSTSSLGVILSEDEVHWLTSVKMQASYLALKNDSIKKLDALALLDEANGRKNDPSLN